MLDLSPEILTVLMFAGLLAGILMGHPLAFVLGGLAVIFGYIGWGPQCFYLFINRIYAVMGNYVMVAIPLFIFMAQLLDRSKIAEELFDILRHLMGPLRGGVALAVILVSVLFGACTGIIGASVTTMGYLALPVMMKYGYDKSLSVGTICAGGTLGILIPPSVMLIIMGNQASLSVGKLFAGAVIPGMILAGLYIVYILIKCHFNPAAGPPVSAAERAAMPMRRVWLRAVKSLIPPLILILGVLGSIFTGVATPTEASGVGAFLSLVMIVAYGRFTLQGLYEAVIETAKASTMVITVIAGATCFTGVFMGIGGGRVVEGLLLGLGLGKWGTFIVMMLITFVLGFFIDWVGIVMITFPVFLPIADGLGFDKLWFVVIMAVMLQDSFLTPPFGYALFYIKGVAPPEIRMGDIYRGIHVFWFLMEIGLILCVLFPRTITWLPEVLIK